MAKAVTMPALSPTMTEGKILKWNKKEGDAVKSGDALAEVETDKATLDLEAYDDGTLLKILVGEGQTVAVGSNVGVVGKPGEDVSSFKAGGAAPAAAPAAKPAPAAEAKPTPPPTRADAGRHEAREVPSVRPERVEAAPAPAHAAGERIKSSPLARKMAKERGLDLGDIAGSGPSGRIVARDVEEAARRPPAPRAAAAAPAKGAAAKAEKPALPPLLAFPPRPQPGDLEMTGMRKTIATRMAAAKRDTPHFYLSMDVDMEEAVALRAKLKDLGLAISLNDLILKAAGFGLLRVPEVNRSFENDRIRQNGTIDVGMAVAIPDGLITPVLRNIDRMPLSQVAAAAKDFAERARNKKLKPDEYVGGSVTVSNLGMYGVNDFVAIINPPQSCILAVGAVQDRVVAKDGQPAVRKVMTVTLSGDHRVIDGAVGARYLAEVRNALEQPLALTV